MMLVFRIGILLVGCLLLESFVLKTNKLSDSQCSRTVDIAIVGAGPSGTYFAYKLRHANQSIELIEYSNRIGGRLFTTTLPNIPDIKLELGGMRFVDKQHILLQHLADELHLTQVPFDQRVGDTHIWKLFLRGHVLTPEETISADAPYHLSPEEKTHQNDLAHYYLQQLIGRNISENETIKYLMKDETELYKKTFTDAMRQVATPEGRQFLKDMSLYSYGDRDDVTAVQFFINHQLFHQTKKASVFTIREGMSSLPISLAQMFVLSSSRHKLTLNRKLEVVSKRVNGVYKLQLQPTKTTADSVTVEKGDTECIYVKKLILAIPQYALVRLKWSPLRSPEVKRALFAVTPSKASKVFLTFPKAWWLHEAKNVAFQMVSDLPFRQMFNWGSSQVSGEGVMLASYAIADEAEYLQDINCKSESGCSEPGGGIQNVTGRLKEVLFHNLALAFGIDRSQIPEPPNSISYFWSSYPFGGAWTEWKSGYNFSKVMQTIRHPSLKDDVFIVGADHAYPGMTGWIESALVSVETVYDKYFT